MEISVASAEGTPTVALAGVPTLAELQRCRQVLLTTLDGARSVTLRLDAIEMADLAFAQLLCAAHRTAAARGGEISLTGAVPPALVELLQRAGLERCAGGPPGCLLRRLLSGRAT